MKVLADRSVKKKKKRFCTNRLLPDVTQRTQCQWWQSQGRVVHDVQTARARISRYEFKGFPLDFIQTPHRSVHRTY